VNIDSVGGEDIVFVMSSILLEKQLFQLGVQRKSKKKLRPF